MTHLPDITQEQALAVLLKNAKLQQAPTSRRPLPLEAVIGVGKNNHAIVAIQPEDLEALNALLAADPVSPGAAQPADAQTARHDLMDGKVIALENYRPANDDCPNTPEELAKYALGELEPFIQLAKEGKIKAIGIAVELVDNRSSITYPVNVWEPGLIAAVELLKLRLLQQQD